jgi:DNA-binding SARP family transcriptional activator
MAPAKTEWRMECFGVLRAVRGPECIDKFRTQKTAAVLALLSLRGGRSRENICALLWPDSSPEAARSSLSSALSLCGATWATRSSVPTATPWLWLLVRCQPM